MDLKSTAKTMVNKSFGAVGNEIAGQVGRFTGNLLLDYLTKEGVDSRKDDDEEKGIAYDKDDNVADYKDLKMQPGQTMRDFRKQAVNLTPRYTKEDLPEGFGVRKMFGGMIEDPVSMAVTARNIAPYAGMAVGSTALATLFGGKPSSEYKVPVSPMTAYGDAMGAVNQNVMASNVSSRNAVYLENLKYQHQLDLIRAKNQANTPGVQVDPSAYGPMGSVRPALNEEVKEVARMLYGTGLKL